MNLRRRIGAFLLGRLLKFLLAVERFAKRQSDYSLNDPEWNEAQNEMNALKRDLNRRIANINKEYP